MPTRPLRFAISLALAIICVPLLANVRGHRGLGPELPDNIPGIDRPFPQDDDKFTFAIIGDKTGGGLRNWPIFDRAMDEVSRLHPDFAIMVGDLIQGYPKTWTPSPLSGTSSTDTRSAWKSRSSSSPATTTSRTTRCTTTGRRTSAARTTRSHTPDAGSSS
jgi:hypothetical protein